MVNGTAIACVPLMVHGTVQVYAAVSPGVGLHVGNEATAVQQRIVCIIKTHLKNLLGSPVRQTANPEK